MLDNSSVGRYFVLDGIRGLAAAAIMISHYSQFLGMGYFKAAGSAVDLFFVLSGFVIAHSYTSKISMGLPFSEFLLRRLIRLAPLNCFAVVVAFVAIWTVDYSYYPAYQLESGAVGNAVVLQLLFLPYFNHFQWPYGNYGEVNGVFPLNLPAWSLFFEMLAYVVFFAYTKYFSRIKLVTITLIFYLSLILSLLIFLNLNPGALEDDFYLGIPRVLGNFFIGAFIYHVSKRPVRWPLQITTLLLCTIFAIFTTTDLTLGSLNILVLIPLLIFFSSQVDASGRLKRICETLGFISFPLYIVHVPLITLALHEHQFISHYSIAVQRVGLILLALLCALLFGYLDLWIRQFLTRHLVGRGRLYR